MRYRRLITAITLIAFLPLSTGCSKSRTVGVSDEPTGSSSSSRLHAGESVAISGYTRADDGFRAWDGRVRLAHPDSLEFEATTPSGEPVSRFVLHASEVTSIRAVETDKVATTILVATSLLAIGGAVVAATFAAAMDDFGY
jgi:hypothetical protein